MAVLLVIAAEEGWTDVNDFSSRKNARNVKKLLPADGMITADRTSPVRFYSLMVRLASAFGR
jgi:hypothetical protein